MDRMKHQVAEATRSDQFELYALPGAVEASKVSPMDSAPYALINRTIREVFPGTLVAPGLMIAATDSVRFGEISDHISSSRRCAPNPRI